jgi:RNA polymerase sigma-70 factor (ECF subfamily)
MYMNYSLWFYTITIKIMTTFEFTTQLTNLEDYLRRHALILTLNKEDANDLLQETFLKALKNKEMFMASQYKNLKGWTYTVMKNIFINNYRRIKNWQNKIRDISADNAVTTENNSYEDLFTMIQLKDMNNAIENLEASQKVPLVMHLSGYKYKEIADKLGISIGTVKSRIFFAKKNLKDKI